MTNKISFRRLCALVVALGLPVGTAVVALGAASPAAAAPVCTDPATTKLTLEPATAERAVGDQTTVTGHIECDGKAGQDNTVDLKVEGTNPQKANGTADDSGDFRFSYWDDEGAGDDLVTACTTDLSGKQVCDTATVAWVCPSGQVPNGISCGLVPAFGQYFSNAFENSFSDKVGDVLFPDDTSDTDATPADGTASSTGGQAGESGGTSGEIDTEATPAAAPVADESAPVEYVDEFGNPVDEFGNPL